MNKSLDEILQQARARSSEPEKAVSDLSKDAYEPIVEGTFKSWIKIIFTEADKTKSIGFPYQHLLTCEYILGEPEQILLVGAGLSFVIKGRGLEALQAGILDHKVHEIRSYMGQKKIKGDVFISEIIRSASKGNN